MLRNHASIMHLIVLTKYTKVLNSESESYSTVFREFLTSFSKAVLNGAPKTRKKIVHSFCSSIFHFPKTFYSDFVDIVVIILYCFHNIFLLFLLSLEYYNFVHIILFSLCFFFIFFFSIRIVRRSII